MKLIQTTVLTAISTMVKVGVGFLINKSLAVHTGPSGLAIVGQFHNFISVINAFSNGGIKTGIIKYIAEKSDLDKKKKVISTSAAAGFACSTLLAIIIYVYSLQLALAIFDDTQYENVVKAFSLAIIPISISSILLAILNGLREIRKFILINIIGSVLNLISTSTLIATFGLFGALYALTVNQLLIFITAIALAKRSAWFKLEYFSVGIDIPTLKRLVQFSLMAIVSAVSVPASHFVIRNYIGDELGWDAAGHWQAMWYISSAYILLITSSLGVYYLPKLSSIDEKRLLREEVIQGYSIIIPSVAILAIFVFVLRDKIVLIAFSADFNPVTELFKWQLIGDVLKIAGWLLGYVIVAKAMIKISIVTEVAFSSMMVFLNIVFLNWYGLVGTTYAYAINYLLYFIVMILVSRRVLIG